MSLVTNIYVDGFNLYYGAVKDTKYKWLNILEMCQLLLPQNKINKIRYFTAPVVPRANDLQQRSRQELYWRALKTIPNLSIIQGQFLVKNVPMKLAKEPGFALVIKTEEKGTDVNLASYLLTDAYASDENRYDIAVVISNDSDLCYPIKHVKGFLGKTVGILNPQKNPSFELMKIKPFYKPIRQAVLAKSQFSKTLTDSQGSFSCPSSWL